MAFNSSNMMSSLNVTINGKSSELPPNINIFEAKSTVTFDNVTDGRLTHNDIRGSTSLPNDTNTTYSWMISVGEEVLLLQRIASFIDFWIPPFLFFIGIVTNTFVIMVMRSKHFRHMSTSFYMAVSALVDTVSLLVPLPPHYLYVNFPHIFDSIRHVHVICSICHMSGWVTSNLGVFLTVAMTVDRSLAIQFPLKAPTLCTVRRAKIVTLCLLLLELLMEGHVAFTSRLVPKGVKAYLCVIDRYFSKDYRIFRDYYWPNLHNVSLMLSFLVIIVGNIIIILHVKRSEDSKDFGEGAKSSGGSQPGKSSSSSSKSRQLSLMLIIDSASIIACTLPQTIYMMLDQTFQSTQQVDHSPLDLAKQNLVFAIAFYLIQVNHCINFFLYCISGARFREALKDVMSRYLRQKKKQASRSSSTSIASVYPRSVPMEVKKTVKRV